MVRRTSSLGEGLLRAKRDRSLIKLSQLSGIGYSYISKLANGHKSLESLSPVYRKALEDGLKRLFDDGGEQHAS